MNTSAYNIKEAYSQQLEGVALAYDGEQVDLKKSELPYEKYANKALDLARSINEFDPTDVDEARNEPSVYRDRETIDTMPASRESMPVRPQEYVKGLGKRIETLRESYGNLAA